MESIRDSETAPKAPGSRRPSPDLGAIPLGPGAEFDLIRMLLTTVEGSGSESVQVGPGDDCAVLEDGLVVSTDLSIEGIHFRRSWLSAREIGFRSVAAALSDLAAMAADPLGALVSLALGADAEELVRPIGFGIRDACASGRAVLLGGDLSRSPGPIILDVTVLGRSARPITRAGARPGDEVWVTGHLGASGLAVRIWEQGREPHASLREAFAYPTPRLREARWLAERAQLHALIDLSDGLGGDAGHLAAASGVRVELDAPRLPVHPRVVKELESETERVRAALSGGEDYELCLVAPPGQVEALSGDFEHAFHIPLTRVGAVREGEGVVLLDGEGSAAGVEIAGFNHFDSEGA